MISTFSINYKTHKPFRDFAQYRVILVTGCQRSGTTIAAQMISHDTGFVLHKEESFGIHDESRFRELVASSQGAVVQCPGMMHIIHELTADDVLIICMRRDYQDIYDSMMRIGWVERGDKLRECAKYRVPIETDIIAHKYHRFDMIIPNIVPHAYEMQYETLRKHILWLDKADRTGFNERSTEKRSNPTILIATLGYRHLIHAMASHAKAASYLQSQHIRFDWLTAYGMPRDLGSNVTGHSIVTRKYQQVQEAFLKGDYDIFIAIEDDMIIPEDTFPRLLKMLNDGADVAYGLYCWRHNVGGGGWSAYTRVEAHYGESICNDAERATQAFINQDIVTIAGVGLGCTAIKRDVLEHIRFTRRGHACNDWYFAIDAQAKGYTQHCDMGLVCGHMSLDPSPRVIFPDIENQETLQRIVYL